LFIINKIRLFKTWGKGCWLAQRNIQALQKNREKKTDVGRVPIICKNILSGRMTFSTGENDPRSIKSHRTYVSNPICKKYIVKNF